MQARNVLQVLVPGAGPLLPYKAAHRKEATSKKSALLRRPAQVPEQQQASLWDRPTEAHAKRVSEAHEPPAEASCQRLGVLHKQITNNTIIKQNEPAVPHGRSPPVLTPCAHSHKQGHSPGMTCILRPQRRPRSIQPLPIVSSAAPCSQVQNQWPPSGRAPCRSGCPH
eukprot:1160260-Pelagomonas_calceolata.AAC.2